MCHKGRLKPGRMYSLTLESCITSEYILESSCLPVPRKIPRWEQCTLDFTSKYLYLLDVLLQYSLKKQSWLLGVRLAKGSWDFFTGKTEPMNLSCENVMLHSHSPGFGSFTKALSCHCSSILLLTNCPVTFRTDKFFDRALCLYSGIWVKGKVALETGMTVFSRQCALLIVFLEPKTQQKSLDLTSVCPRVFPPSPVHLHYYHAKALVPELFTAYLESSRQELLSLDPAALFLLGL